AGSEGCHLARGMVPLSGMEAQDMGKAAIAWAWTALAALCASAAWGQGAGRPPGGGPILLPDQPPTFALLIRPEVQAELKLTDAQKAKVKTAQQQWVDSVPEFTRKLQNARAEDRPKLLAERRAEEPKRIQAILTPEQYNQLREIASRQLKPSPRSQPPG